MAVKLKAKNSNGKYSLCIDRQKGEKEVWLVIAGTYKGTRVQFEFDNLSKKQRRKMVSLLKNPKEI